METRELIMREVFERFVESNDFNGIPLTRLVEKAKCTLESTIDIIKEMVLSDDISIQTGINPGIIGVGHYTAETQLAILEEAKKNHTKIVDEISTDDRVITFTVNSHPIAVYPSPSYLKRNRDVSAFSHRPFTRELALGSPQLKPIFFEIEVLERYTKDPRYSFVFNDYSGQISYTSGDDDIPNVRESDQIFLQTFGLGVDEKLETVAVVYLRYLKNLTPEHQIYWSGKRVENECRMREEYYLNTIEGSWATSRSLFTAFIEEQKALNDITSCIFSTALFNETFEDEKRPKEFNILFIPTLKNYQEFVLLCDKMISDNINKAFFESQGIALFDLKEIGNGLFERERKGTLRLLSDWLLDNYYGATNAQLVKELIQPFKDIRQERQKPAHKIDQNVYDKHLTKKQTELMKKLYFTMQILRKIFHNHPEGKNVKIKDWLDSGRVIAF